MEKQNVLSKLKNKYLLIALAFFVPTLMIAGASQTKNTDVKGVQIIVTQAPTMKSTNTPTPTDTPIPTITPNTPYPTKAYIAPTKAYIPPTHASVKQSNSQLDNNTNTADNTVHSPANTIDGSVPAGATARCADGTYSFSQSRRGICSHHSGVAS